MSTPTAFPGVHVSEIDGGGYTITPVATNITAFVGRAPLGPTDVPVTVFNYGDFTRFFGGLQLDYPMSYAVRDFFANGGSQAVIARLFEPDGGDGVARLSLPGAPLLAASPGAWGNRLAAAVDTSGITDASSKPFERYGIEAKDLFNLTLTLHDAPGRTVATERFLNLAVSSAGAAAEYPDRLDRVLANQSNLARADALAAAPPPAGAAAAGVGGNDGTWLSPAAYLGDGSGGTGIRLLERGDVFNLLCIPPDRRLVPGAPAGEQDLDPAVRQAAALYCVERRAFYIVDPPADWSDKAAQGQIAAIDPASLGIGGAYAAGIEVSRNAAVYFPRIWRQDPLAEAQPGLFAPCGAVAGVFAATDVARGVWKAPAGIDAGLADVARFEIRLNDEENGILNPLGINCLRDLPTIGPVVWGARTLRGADILGDDYKYVSVRRLALFVEECLARGTQWATFEPNDEALWSSLRLSVGAFLADLKRQGAFYDYFVKCDSSTTTRDDVDNGVVNILVGFAAVKPAEFLVIHIQQAAGAGPG